MRKPTLAPKQWLNPDQRPDLNGQVVMINFWDYSCIYSLEMLPYLRQWHIRYQSAPLTIIGVHTPQFAFGRERAQIEVAVEALGLQYPIYLDNDRQVWDAYQNRFYPALYLIDREGAIRYQHYGDGNYTEIERALQNLLRECDSDLSLPPVIDYQEAESYERPTRQLHGGLQRGALGNPEGYAARIPILYRLPNARQSGAFYVEGAWIAADEYLMYQGQTGGIVQIPYEAKEVYAVLSPHADTVERMIHPEPIAIDVWQDEQPIFADRRGVDLTEDGRVWIDRPRPYNLVRNPGLERHELTLRVSSKGFTLYRLAFINAR